MQKTIHLVLRSHLLDQTVKLFRSDCNRWQSSMVLIGQSSLVSLANILAMEETIVGMSLVLILNCGAHR